MSRLDDLRIDRTAFSIGSLHEQGDDRKYWFARTPQERLAAVEIMRQISYGYDPTTARIQRVLEFAQLKGS